MMRVGSWLYGKKPANASTQSVDSLSEVKDCMYRDLSPTLMVLPHAIWGIRNGELHADDLERGSG